MKRVLKYVLLILFFSLAILLFNQSLVKAETLTTTIGINGQILSDEYKYLVNGVRAENGTLGSGGCTAQFDSVDNILTLNGYNGKGIHINQKENFTIKLIGNNKITEDNSSQAWGIYSEIAGALTITSDSEASLTINAKSVESEAAGIVSDFSKVYTNDSIVIGGKANIIVNATSNRGSAAGIDVNSSLSILENASFTSTAKYYYSDSTYVRQGGIETTRPLTINTKGNIFLDVSHEPTPGHSYYSYGIYSKSTFSLQNVGIMTIKYPSKQGAAGNASWTIPEKFTVNEGIVDGVNTKEIRSGNGIVYTLTLESAVDNFGKSTGQYFSGDAINIKGSSNIVGLKFKDWLFSAGLIENNLSEKTIYTMPNSNATVTANYSPFATQPKFTKISNSSGNIDYALNEGFSESERRLVKSGENAEDEFSCNHVFLGTPYEINEGTATDQVPAGEYKIAVKKENKWYYSDIFIVNYDEQIPDDNTENNIENNTVNNVGNNMVNNTRLPQTGEKKNIFVEWLKIAIPLMTFWLVSMIWIDYEKKKMTKK